MTSPPCTPPDDADVGAWRRWGFEHRWTLSTWEEGFLQRLHDSSRWRRPLSAKQLEVLRRMAAAVEAMALDDPDDEHRLRSAPVLGQRVWDGLIRYARKHHRLSDKQRAMLGNIHAKAATREAARQETNRLRNYVWK